MRRRQKYPCAVHDRMDVSVARLRAARRCSSPVVRHVSRNILRMRTAQSRDRSNQDRTATALSGAELR